MKLKTLTINNIASIENATIDFAKGALADQDLFLICGPTGSGKTTILDAICLALFNTTPRIEGSTTDIVDNMTAANEKKRVKDVLHLVRKNAINAFVELVFEAENRDYTATWRVYRKGQYRQGKEVSTFVKKSLAEKINCDFIKEWTLTDSDGKVYTKDLKETITDVIKMTFTQFCKTTMLAQGDFTRFLASTSDEKAHILEKLVGTEQYAAVGKVINQTANKKRNDVEVLAKELENFKFLSDEEKAEKQKVIEELHAEIKTIAEQKAAIEKKLQWIADSAKATADEAQSRTTLEKAEQALAVEDVKREKQTIELWDKTSEVREALAQKTKHEAVATENRTRKQHLSDEYDIITSGLCRLADHKKELMEKQAEQQEWLDSQSRFEEMFSKTEVICSTNANIAVNEKTISANTLRLKELDEKLGTLNNKKEKLSQDKEADEAEIKRLEQTVDAQKTELKINGADTIDAEVAELNKRRTLLTATETASKLWIDAQNDFTTKQQTAETVAKTLKELGTKELEKRELLAKATATLKASQERYEKTKESVSDHAKVLRATLQVGDNCPVCGKTVEQILTDDCFIAALQPLLDEYKANETKAQALTNEYAHIKAELSVSQKAADTAAKDEKTAKTKLDNTVADLQSKCRSLGIVWETDIDTQLQALNTQLSASEAAIAIRQQAIRSIREKIDAANSAIAKIRNEHIKVIDNQLVRLQEEIELIDKRKSQTTGAIENAKQSLETLRHSLKQLINPDWQPEGDIDFFEALRQAADKYTKTKKEQSETEAGIKLIRQDLSLIASCKETVDRLFPEWTNRNVLYAKDVPEISRRWSRMQSDCSQLAASIATTAEALEKTEAVINDFKKNHPDISIDAVAQLVIIPTAAIVDLRSHISRLETSCSQAKALHELAMKNKAAFSNCPLNEGETAESLREQTAIMTQKEQNSAQAIGRLNSELDTDARNLLEQGKKKAELDTLRKEYTEWETLNRYLGGNIEGKNFRNIAQSFILADLLEKANAYLANISTRYTLFCNPGTLTIMLRDAYQGGVVRTTNTLSGGESFIISLSLALGLSSMQNVDLEVDTLFIDEGFGTLSPEFLDPVIVALKRLHESYGRRVGIISHVETLKSRIPATIEISKSGNTSSKVEVKLN